MLLLCLWPLAIYVCGMAGGLAIFGNNMILLFGTALLALVYSITMGVYMYGITRNMS